MIPETFSEIDFWDHLMRYAFACRYVRGLRVLDIASGEGYGTAVLSRLAAACVGVDVDPEAVEHARAKYGLRYEVGSAEAIPLDAETVDAVVSFETIEHVPEPDMFLREAWRVLSPGGLLVVSTPNREVYRRGGAPNPFHVREFAADEFVEMLGASFHVEGMWGQRFGERPVEGLQRVLSRVSHTGALAVRKAVERVIRRCFSGTLENTPEARLRALGELPRISAGARLLWASSLVKPVAEGNIRDAMYLVAVARKKEVVSP